MKIDVSELKLFKGKVKTDEGFISFEQAPEKIERCYELHFDNFTIVKVSWNHLFEDIDGEWKIAEFLDENTKIKTDEGYTKLLTKIYIGEHKTYDLTVNSEKHQYYLDGISSHNTGKTLLAITAGMRLSDMENNPINRIIYVRNSIESIQPGEDVGYLSGNKEKFQIYNHPLYDTITFLAISLIKKARNKRTENNIENNEPISNEEIAKKVEELNKKYQFETMWSGEMRGRNLSNAFVILDECQNTSKETAKLIATRIDSSCRLIAIGSNRQIDNSYENKYTNGLTSLIKSTKNKYDGVNLFAISLKKVLRGPVTKFAEDVFV